MSDDRERTAADPDAEDAALADWIAELVDRLEEGEPLDLSALAKAYPERAEELRRVLPTIRRMASFGRAVTRGSDPARVTAPSRRGATLGTLGDFRLLREVGRGGMGVVYEAQQVSLGRRVALKVLPLAGALDSRQHQRFLLEARAAACLHHAHIVPVYAVGSEQGVPYYAMQFIDGRTLAEILEELLRSGPGSVLVRAQTPTPSRGLGTSNRDRTYIRAVAEHGRRAAEALDHAHGRGIIHRDIKPANLMLDADAHLWITDFGLAQVQGDSRLTLTGDVVGTLRYMSPEQALAKRVVVDGRTDLYSLGATLYELLALRPVFDGADRAEILRKIAQDEPAPLAKLNPSVPQDLETIIHKALAKEASERYATARELADDLGRFLEGRPTVARPPGPRERLAKWLRRNRAIVVPATCFSTLALLALASGLVWSNNWLTRHNDQLRNERDRAKNLAKELKEQRDLAEQRRRLADRHLYAFRLRQAGEALRARQFEKAQDILLDARPESGEDDPREFAWHYLWRESRREVVVLSERSEEVLAMALSPDGRTVATGDRDGTIRLRDSETGALLARHRSSRAQINELAFWPDGRRLASGTGIDVQPDIEQHGELLMWDVATGKTLARLDGFERRFVWYIRPHPSGRYLWEASNVHGEPDEIGLWSLEDDNAGVRPRLLRRWRTLPSNLPISMNGLQIAHGNSNDGILTVEDGASGKPIHRFTPRHAGFQCAGLSSNGRLVAASEWIDAAHSGAAVSVFDLDSGRPLITDIGVPFKQVADLLFSPDARHLIIRGVDGTVHAHNLATHATWTIPVPKDDAGQGGAELFFLFDGKLLSCSYRGVHTGQQPLRLHEVDTGAVRATFPGRVEFAHSVFGRALDRSVAFRSGTRAIVWHVEPAADPQPTGHLDEAWTVAFSHDGRLIATGSDDTDDPQTVKLCDAASGRLVRGWKAHMATTGALAFQPGGHILASTGLSETDNVRLWDAVTGALLATLDGHTDKVRTIAFRPDGQLLASAGSDRTIRLWDMATRRHVRTLTGHSDKIRQVMFSPDGRLLVSVSGDSTVRVWDVARAETEWTWKGSAKISSVAFSPDGRTLAWCHEDGVIQRWDLVLKEGLAPLHSEYGELRCLAFSPDGRTLAAAGTSGRIHLWDPILGQVLLTIDGPPCQVNALAFSPDGSSLAGCWHDGLVKIVRAR